MVEFEEGDTGEIERETNTHSNAMKELDKFDSKMKGGRLFGGGGDSSSDEEDNYTRPMTENDILKQKNQILMDKLFKS